MESNSEEQVEGERDKKMQLSKEEGEAVRH